jgi:hypothetical protein
MRALNDGAAMAAFGPTMPTLAVQQVGSDLGYTDRCANIIGEASIYPEAR